MLTPAEIRDMNIAAQDQGITGVHPALHLARAVEAATLATVTPLVQRERERCAAVCRDVSAEDKAAVERETNSVLRSRFDYGAIVAEECASRILLGNEPAAQPAQAGADRAEG